MRAPSSRAVPRCATRIIRLLDGFDWLECVNRESSFPGQDVYARTERGPKILRLVRRIQLALHARRSEAEPHWSNGPIFTMNASYVPFLKVDPGRDGPQTVAVGERDLGGLLRHRRQKRCPRRRPRCADTRAVPATSTFATKASEKAAIVGQVRTDENRKRRCGGIRQAGGGDPAGSGSLREPLVDGRRRNTH